MKRKKRKDTPNNWRTLLAENSPNPFIANSFFFISASTSIASSFFMNSVKTNRNKEKKQTKKEKKREDTFEI